MVWRTCVRMHVWFVPTARASCYVEAPAATPSVPPSQLLQPLHVFGHSVTGLVLPKPAKKVVAILGHPLNAEVAIVSL